ncbi:hypothetical protein HRQ91_05875 [Treponema parvum]|uniref:Uncharacterized protein n=1 Tax=Treponema parvum TaxID=138851 RepID=A0A975F455_9SPIR|nr:hypothetical protein [Treponema parvum]QTQ14018.1 hypothetical protein HRQ91_05875 [Treponema parvum]
MMDQIKHKNIKKIGLGFGILFFLFSVMILLMSLAKNPWNKGLQKAVSQVLETHYPNTYKIQRQYAIRSGFYAGGAAFKLTDKNNADAGYAVIMGITTMYGQYPAVFMRSSDGKTSFVDFLCLPPDLSKRLAAISKNSSISYWLEKNPEILGITGRQR